MKTKSFPVLWLALPILGLAAYSLTSIATQEPLPKWKPGNTRRLSDVELARLASSAGWTGEELVRAVAVALAESGGYSDAFLWNRHKFSKPSQDRGLWQINSKWHPELSESDAWNPKKNAAFAFGLWKRYGWKPWITWQTDAHQAKMARARRAVARAFPATIPTPTTLVAPKWELEDDAEVMSRAIGISGARAPLSPVQIARLAKSAGWTGLDLAVATAVALAESEGDSRVTSKNKDGSRNVGLWQINADASNQPVEPLKEPEINAMAARKIWAWAKGRKPSPWSPWGAYTDQRYLQFMPTAQAAVQEISA